MAKAKNKAAAAAASKKASKGKGRAISPMWLGAAVLLLLVVAASSFYEAESVEEQRRAGGVGGTSKRSCVKPDADLRRMEQPLASPTSSLDTFADLQQWILTCKAHSAADEFLAKVHETLRRAATRVSSDFSTTFVEHAIKIFGTIDVHYRTAGRQAASIPFVRTAASFQPDNLMLKAQLASMTPSFRESVSLYKEVAEALDALPNPSPEEQLFSSKIHHNLGNKYMVTNSNYTLAHEHLSAAVDVHPTGGKDSKLNLAIVKREMGFVEEARELMLECTPPWALNVHQNLLTTEYYRQPDRSVAASSSVLMEQVRTLTNFLQPSIDDAMGVKSAVRVTSDCSAGHSRPLRIAFVSSNFPLHAQFLEPVLRHIDREQFHVEVWADLGTKGGTQDPPVATDAIRSIEDVVFHDTDGLGISGLSTEIVSAAIDIVVEMGRHTAHNKLLLIAQVKPAPVALTWVGGPLASSGVRGMDGILCDRFHCPPNVGIERYFKEKIYRLEHGYAPFAPAQEFGVLPIYDGPVVRNNYVTFGSYNKPAKITEDSVRMWASVLMRVPRSRMIVQGIRMNEPAAAERVLSLFEENKIARSRITIKGKLEKEQWLASFNNVDIMLDTFPYAGGVTTLQALYMGVPVVTLCAEGGPYWACHSTAYVSTLLADGRLVSKLAPKDWDTSDMWKWATTSEADYIHTAVALASGKGARGKGGVREAHQRQAIREALLSSPICTESFIEPFQNALKAAWEDFACPGLMYEE